MLRTPLRLAIRRWLERLSWAVRGPLGTGVRGSGDFGEGENRRRGSDSRWYEVTGIHLITELPTLCTWRW